MASRKDQKEQARAARLAQEQQAVANKQRTRRLQIIGGVVAIAVIVVVVAIVVSSSGGGSNAPKAGTKTSTGLATGAKEKQIVAQVDTLLKGIPQSATTMGNSSAKVTMEYFGDLECPICRDFTLGTAFPQFIKDQVRPGNVKVTYRSMCTATCGSHYSQAQDEKFFDTQQVAGYAAGKQSKFWQYAELFYRQQGEENTGYADEAFLTGLANQVTGLEVPTWQTDRKDPSLLSQVNADQAYAQKANLPGTPSLIMKGPKGEELVNGGESLPTYSQLVAAVQAVS
jgi:protein-disulfide isomerase